MDALAVHVVDGVAATAAHTYDFDFGGTFVKWLELHVWCSRILKFKRKRIIFHVTYFLQKTDKKLYAYSRQLENIL